MRLAKAQNSALLTGRGARRASATRLGKRTHGSDLRFDGAARRPLRAGRHAVAFPPAPEGRGAIRIELRGPADRGGAGQAYDLRVDRGPWTPGFFPRSETVRPLTFSSMILFPNAKQCAIASSCVGNLFRALNGLRFTASPVYLTISMSRVHSPDSGDCKGVARIS